MDKPTNVPREDQFTIRCRKLGHLIHFAYCRRENGGLPCLQALDCWFSFFPVADFLRRELSPEEWATAFEQPRKPKVLTLVELIEQAQKRVKKP